MREETKKMSYHLSVNGRSALLPLRHFLWLLLRKAPPSGVYPFRKAFLTWNLLWCHTCILKWKNTFLTALRTLQLNGEDREMIKVAVIQRLNVFGNYLVEGGKATLRVSEYSFDRFKSFCLCLLCVCVGLTCNYH